MSKYVNSADIYAKKAGQDDDDWETVGQSPFFFLFVSSLLPS
jgi:hypothetical protein